MSDANESSQEEAIVEEEIIVDSTNSSPSPPPFAPTVPVRELHAPHYRAFSLGESITRGFQGFFDFKTRAARSEYWWWTFFTVLVMVGAIFVDLLFFFATGWTFPLLFTLVLVIFFVPSLAVSVRRLHDRNMTGWFILINLLPFGGIVLFVFYLLESNPGENDFGANPLEQNAILKQMN
jgi:uncharacterized membrane protein YhaH (DUF805 family)